MIASATPTIAETEWETIFRKGQWSVDINYDTDDGSYWCTADTQSGDQVLSFSVWEDGAFGVFVFDDNWTLRERELEFLVQVDTRGAWTMNGNASDQSIYIFPDVGDSLRNFLGEVMQGNTLVVANSAGEVVADFSLSGSYAAVTELMGCYEKIADTDSDPFD